MSKDPQQKRNVHILPPEDLTGLISAEPSTKAAGIPGLTHAIRHLSEEMGLWKGLKLMAKVNQIDGIDCPGCAWPDPKHRSALGEYCENGAKAIAEEATDKHCGEEFFKSHSVEEMSSWSDFKIGKSGRVIHPMYLEEGSSYYRKISWDEAFGIVSSKLKSLSSPDEAVFYTSGRTSNEAAFAYQLMVRMYGTNNMPDCSNMCHESSGVGLSSTLGIGKGSVTLEDLYEAEVIMVMGQNPGTNHPRMLSAMQKCKKNGGKIIHVNPLPEVGTSQFVDPQSPIEILTGGTQLADHFLQLKINGDIPLLKILMRILLQKEMISPGKVFDHEFISQYCEGYDEFIEELKNVNVEELLDECGLGFQEVEEVATLLAEKKKIIVCWAMGITQHRNGVDNVKEIVNLLLLKGSIGKAGAGTCPVRGHSNVQGDRTMGIYEKPSEGFLNALEDHFKFSAPKEHGLDTVDAIRAMADKKVKLFFSMGGNFISATPDSEFTGMAMQECDLTVQVSTKLNRAHLVTGKSALILPCLGRTERDIQSGEEQFVTVENSMGVVSSSRGTYAPASDDLKSEVAVVCGISKILFEERSAMWEAMEQDYDKIRDHIEAVIPGFMDYNARVRISGGFYLPNPSRDRRFLQGKAHFSVVENPQVKPKEGQYVLMTIRSHDQFNTTIYGLDDRYRGILNERRILFIHPLDAEESNLKEGEEIDIVSRFQGEERFARKFIVKPYSIARGCLATYFPEANSLVALNSVAKDSNTPASKFVEVDLLKRS